MYFPARCCNSRGFSTKALLVTLSSQQMVQDLGVDCKTLRIRCYVLRDYPDPFLWMGLDSSILGRGLDFQGNRTLEICDKTSGISLIQSYDVIRLGWDFVHHQSYSSGEKWLANMEKIPTNIHQTPILRKCHNWIPQNLYPSNTKPQYSPLDVYRVYWKIGDERSEWVESGLNKK